MAGYSRQSVADIIANAVIKAAPVNAEYNAIRDAFAFSGGHRHDGSSNEGAYVPLIADLDGENKVVVDTVNNRISVYTEVSGTATEQLRIQDGAIVPVTDDDIDLGSTTLEFKNLYLDGIAKIDTLTVDENATVAGTLGVTGAISAGSLTITGNSTHATVDINGGTIDGTIIGASTPAASTFTTVTTTGQATLASADINGGTIDGSVIGGTTAQAVTGTTITANTGFAGALTGNVTGNVSGNLTGNVTGDVTGDLTGNVAAASGSSTFNDLTVNGTLDVTGTTIANVTDPVNAQDAATKNYVDTAVADVVDAAPAALDTLNELAAALGDDAAFSTTVTNSIATKLPLAGGTMSGVIAMGTSKITGMGDPTANQDASTKAYTDTQDATKLNLSGGTMTGAIDMGANKVTTTYTPTDNADLTTKTYVDGILGSATAAATSAANAATSETNAATSETNASNSASAASTSESNAAASYDSFDDRYLGAKATAPTVDNDGDALITGALYFNSTSNIMYVYGGAGWQAAGSSVNGTSDRQTYTAAAGQTVFAATYDTGYIDVYLNGVKLLAGTDFTATNGTSITLATGASVNDIVDLVAYGTFVLSDHYTEAQSDARFVNVTGDTMTGNLNVTGTITATSFAGDGSALTGLPANGGVDLSAIAETKAVTAVDVFVYDTSKDSDGGAWRKRTQATSWYNETLNTATRGSRKEFPAVAVIVAETDTVTIYDGDDPSLPMWMVFNASGPNMVRPTVRSVAALNAVFTYSASDNFGQIDFLLDDGFIRAAIGAYYEDRRSIVERNTSISWISPTPSGAIVNDTVNDVAMTVLPNAPTDAATGLPVPTIAVATNGGVSVITDSGAVYDSAYSSAHSSVNIYEDRLSFGYKSADNVRFVNISEITADGWTGTDYGDTTTPALFGSSAKVTASNAISNSRGLNFLAEDPTPANGMIAYTTSTYNTGWMNGDIKGAFLSDTDDTDLVGGTDADRSVNGNDLTANGTITRTPVATGADLVAYSGFSESNYLEQPYNSDLDFGTGDFCIMGWFNQTTSTSTQYFVVRSDGASNIWQVGMTSTNDLLFIINGSFPARTAAAAYADNTWNQVVFVREAGVAKIYLNGSLTNNVNSGTNTTSVDLAASSLYIGESPLSRHFRGSLALMRISATAPTAAQIAKIYNDEKVLFQENAQATLYGTSNAVTALAHDDATDLLHVGTSAGRSVFQGLRRVSNTTNAVGTAISASNDLVVEE